ncbi:MAG: MBL fold metallo-hydrolase [Xanthomonadales bacterium]|nr:Beta-lactamase hydrolase-like protein [Xanthomonadales bacterium]MCC6593903.1 MBL fold metallo-hydrolase [Xanthomonadales bacterium]MCE7932741.1 MBL fold metallo-hydrolase [Xanthomonadales bacterium PRO6]
MQPKVTPFFHAQSSTWTYLVRDPATRVAAIVDPCLDFDPKAGRTGTRSAAAVLAALESDGLELAWILETHAHADHLSAGRWLKSQRPQARLAIGQGIREVQRTFKPVYNLGAEFATDGRQFDHLFADGEEFAIGDLPARVIATPGHTNDSVSYLIGDALFVGDTLFMPDGGSARCDFPGGSAARLYQSIQRLYALPDSTRVYVCHDYGPGGREVRCETSIGAQKAGNIHLRADIPQAEFVRIREARDATLDMPALILPAIQVNIRAGELPEPESNGVRYLKLPLDRF